jgi:hypothetical protein
MDANKGKTVALKQMSDHDMFKASVQKEIDDLKTAIIAGCNDLKKICKNYNLVAELTDLITQLELESQGLQSIDAKQTCQQFVDSLKQLVDTLMADPNMAKVSTAKPNLPKKTGWFGW